MMRHTEFGPWHSKKFRLNDAQAECPDYWLGIWLDFAKIVRDFALRESERSLILCSDKIIKEKDIELSLRFLTSGALEKPVKEADLEAKRKASGLFSADLAASALSVYEEIIERQAHF